MYAGAIVEQGTVDDIFYAPAHPYTLGLLRSVPDRENNLTRRLATIEGAPADSLRLPAGCPFAPRCESCMLNSVGLQNPGLRAVCEKDLPELMRIYGKPVIANISGFSVGEYVECAKAMDLQECVGIIEVNVSCPNVHNGGMSFGVIPESAAEVTRAVKRAVSKPVYVKLSPNVTDIVSIAKACEEAGADGLSLINTLLAMRIDLKTRKPVLANKFGGMSAIALRKDRIRPLVAAGVGFSTENCQYTLRVVSTENVHKAVQRGFRVIFADTLNGFAQFFGSAVQQVGDYCLPERIVHHAVEFRTLEIVPAAAIGNLAGGILPDFSDNQRFGIFTFYSSSQLAQEVLGQLVGDVEPPAAGAVIHPFLKHAVFSGDEAAEAGAFLINLRKCFDSPPCR